MIIQAQRPLTSDYSRYPVAYEMKEGTGGVNWRPKRSALGGTGGWFVALARRTLQSWLGGKDRFCLYYQHIYSVKWLTGGTIEAVSEAKAKKEINRI